MAAESGDVMNNNVNVPPVENVNHGRGNDDLGVRDIDATHVQDVEDNANIHSKEIAVSMGQPVQALKHGQQLNPGIQSTLDD